MSKLGALRRTQTSTADSVANAVAPTTLEDDEERAEFPSTRVLLTVWNERLRIAKDIVAVLEDEQREVFATRIAATTRFAELSSRRATIFTYDPDGSGANDYMSLAQEIARAS
jgi:cellulose biosynthesis protein BcsQ